MTLPEAPWQLQALSKDQGAGCSPIPGNLHPFPLISIWNYPAYKNEPQHISQPHSPSVMDHILSVCGVCFSPNLNKSISHLSLCLSLNSFCDETSRTWASLGPETRYQGLISCKTIFPLTGGGAMVWGWFKCIIFIVHFISNLMLPLIWEEEPVHGLEVADPRLEDPLYLPLATASVLQLCMNLFPLA